LNRDWLLIQQSISHLQSTINNLDRINNLDPR